MANVGTLTIQITNPEALEALGEVAEILADLEEDLPWREDVKLAKERFEFGMRHLAAKTRKERER